MGETLDYIENEGLDEEYAQHQVYEKKDEEDKLLSIEIDAKKVYGNLKIGSKPPEEIKKYLPDGKYCISFMEIMVRDTETDEEYELYAYLEEGDDDGE